MVILNRFLSLGILFSLFLSVSVLAATGTGGNITTIIDGGLNYTVHTFTSSGTFTITSGGNIEYLVVGAGGGGGQGGGGGGGIITGSSSFATQVCTITVGPTTGVGSNGANSVISRIEGNLTGLGGGRGGRYASNQGPGQNGGSGGGGLGLNPPYGGGSGLQSNVNGNYGNDGCGGEYKDGGFSGGGGGAGGGGCGGSGGVANGGPGKLLWGTTYSKGGTGAYTFGTTVGANGGNNTGDGGGGSGTSAGVLVTGGSGVVIVRYLSQLSISFSSDSTTTGTYSRNYIFSNFTANNEPLINSSLIYIGLYNSSNTLINSSNARGINFTNLADGIYYNDILRTLKVLPPVESPSASAVS